MLHTWVFILQLFQLFLFFLTFTIKGWKTKRKCFSVFPNHLPHSAWCSWYILFITLQPAYLFVVLEYCRFFYSLNTFFKWRHLLNLNTCSGSVFPGPSGLRIRIFLVQIRWLPGLHLRKEVGDPAEIRAEVGKPFPAWVLRVDRLGWLQLHSLRSVPARFRGQRRSPRIFTSDIAFEDGCLPMCAGSIMHAALRAEVPWDCDDVLGHQCRAAQAVELFPYWHRNRMRSILVLPS